MLRPPALSLLALIVQRGSIGRCGGNNAISQVFEFLAMNFGGVLDRQEYLALSGRSLHHIGDIGHRYIAQRADALDLQGAESSQKPVATVGG